jgi:aspartate kinase/aspartokinase/homoserine dehydrogenase 1
MQKTVVKFGGSNLRTPEDIQKIVAVVRLYDKPLVVVVSAFYGITNALIDCVRQARGSAGAGDSAAGLTARLRELKSRIVEDNIASAERQAEVMNAIGGRLDQLERYLLGIHYIGDVPEFVNDIVLSYGERLSSLVLAEVLRDSGIDAEEVLPEDMGLVTDGEYGNAACDFTSSEPRVSARLAAGKVFVAPGFYGVSPQGKPTLFGRGGSDYSAAAIARCVGADALDVWKDVDGFLSSDPGQVDRPVLIRHLNYLEAAELSYFGAKILHPRTVEPLFDRNIPIRIMNIKRLGRGLVPFTTIDGLRTVTEGIVKSVTSSDDIGILKLHGPGVGFKRGILARVTGALDDLGINIKSVLTAQTAIDLLLSRSDLAAAFHAVREHHLPGVVDVTCIEDISIVAVVGDGVLDPAGYGTGIAARALSAVVNAGIRVALAGAGASEVAMYLIVGQADRAKAIRILHDCFF